MLEVFQKLSRCHWQLIRSMPKVFISIVLIIGIVEWTILSFVYDNRLSDLRYSIIQKDSTIQNLQERVSQYKEKLDGATPEEASQKIVLLEEKITYLENFYEPKTIILNEKLENTESRICIYSVTIEVASKNTPNGLSVGFTGTKILNLQVSELAQQNSTYHLLPSNEFEKIFYVQKPFGRYAFRVEAEKCQGINVYTEFDGFRRMKFTAGDATKSTN